MAKAFGLGNDLSANLTIFFMRHAQSSSLLLFVIFLSCFVGLIVLTNTYTTQVRQREILENKKKSTQDQIDSFISQTQQEANDQITVYGRKNGIVPYSNDELFKIAPPPTAQ